MYVALSIIVALVGGWLIPWVAMKFIMRARFKSGKQQTTNYAGNTVSYGLGLVWLAWAATLLVFLVKGSWLSGVLPQLFEAAETAGGVGPAVIDSGAGQALLQVVSTYTFGNTFFLWAIPLVVACFFFGWLDDRFGKHGDGGFRGHVKSLFKGKLTTGMAKVLGIGLVALVVSIPANGFGFFDGSLTYIMGLDVFWILLSMCAIALSANLINLFDLRPARASKAYVAAFIDTAFIVVCAAFVITAVVGIFNPWEMLLNEVVRLLWALGPIFAIWRYDAGERAMLGDAGANPAGALLGLYAVVGLWIMPPAFVVLLPLYVLFVLILNLLSEKYSFSEVIEAVPILKQIDMLGRPKN